MSEGSAELRRSPTTRIAVDDIIKRNKILEQRALFEMTDDQLMTQLTRTLLKAWPAPLAAAYDVIGEQLKPFADIAAMLKPEALNEFVGVSPSQCVIIDSRTPWEDFKKDLWRLLFGE
jgi:hypothetical protein